MQVIKRKKEDYFLRVSKGESSLYKEAVKAETLNGTNGVANANEKTENFKYIRDDLEDIEENDIGKWDNLLVDS